MAMIQQWINVEVPVHTLYNQLTQFEDYPRFMQDVEAVRQLDDTHLHWIARMADRSVEWDAEIIEQEPDQFIAWRNVNGPESAGKIEVQPTGPQASRMTFTLEAPAQQVPGSAAGFDEAELAQRLMMDLVRFKYFLEDQGSETGAWRGAIHGDQHAMQDHEAKRETDEQTATPAAPDASRSAPVATSSYAAGSEGWDGTEDPAEPVISAAHNAGKPEPDEPVSTAHGAPPSGADHETQTARATQPDYSLSQNPDSTGNADEDGRFSVAAEMNFDQQSDAARRVGHMPQDETSAAKPAQDMAASMKANEQADQQEASDAPDLKQAIQRSLPPSP